VAVDQSAASLARFDNVKRRLELSGTVTLGGGSVRVYDDFAHHPTAIRTTVNGLRRKLDKAENNGGKNTGGGRERILAVFEPRSNTMKLGSMKSQLPWALEEADLSFCHSANLGWDAADALKPMGAQAKVYDNIERLVEAVVRAVRPGDHILCMSNGGFGGIHAKLLAALAARAAAAGA
jgi:UDP-N-acetylmuramate: L-alanyl-gamma-D-glutamyl-meso-diaminopimelate ligase